MAVKPVEDTSKLDGTTTVRVSQQTHAKLRKLAGELDRPISRLVADAVEEYRHKLFFDDFYEAVARLRADPHSWAEELAERRLWDATLKDGLEPEDWTDADFTQPAEG